MSDQFGPGSQPEFEDFSPTQEEKRRPGCFMTGLIVVVILSLVASSIYSIFWIISQRTEPDPEIPSGPEVAVEPLSAATSAAPSETPAPTPSGSEFAVVPPGANEAQEDSTTEAAATPAGPRVNRLVFVNNRGNIETVAPDGSDRQALTDDRTIYQFPTWSPDGMQIAAVGSTLSGAGVYVLADQPDAEEPQELYFSSVRIPFYLYWAPDSRRISFLANHEEESMSLNLVESSGGAESRLVATGSPFYWNWSANSDEILIHTGADEESRLTLIDDVGRGQMPDIPSPGYFQAPGISAGGEYWAYAQLRPGAMSALVVEELTTGKTFTERHGGTLALSWSPVSQQLAYISGGSERRTGFWGPLRLYDAETGEVRLLSSDLVLAFFWSPDGSKIAYISMPLSQDLGGVEASETRLRRVSRRTPVQISPHQFSLTVVDVTTGEGLRLLDFTPSDLFLFQFLPFFDQYALSHRIWSPDSNAIVLPVENGSISEITVIATGGGQSRVIAEGSAAFWSQQ